MEKIETSWIIGHYSEWGDYFSLKKKAKAIAFGTSRKIKVIIKIKHGGKKWNITDNRSSYSEWGDYCSLEKKEKALAFGTSKKTKVIEKLNTVDKNETSWKKL